MLNADPGAQGLFPNRYLFSGHLAVSYNGIISKGLFKEPFILKNNFKTFNLVSGVISKLCLACAVKSQPQKTHKKSDKKENSSELRSETESLKQLL